MRTLLVPITCWKCKLVHNLIVNPLDYAKYHHRNGYVQNLFPYLTRNERELLVSKTCGVCFDDMFEEEED